jgi:hypothetical protein
MLARARCAVCRAMFSGSREETFDWLRYHQTLHALQATAAQRFAADHARRIDERCAPITSDPRAA